MIGARLPSGDELTVVALIDHNLGAVVKDAYLVGESIADLVEQLRRAMAEDPDLSWHEICLGGAKARVTDAIARGAITFPLFETERWPGCRPLVEWIARSLPDGGTGYQRPEWDEQATQARAGRFLGSPFGAGFDDAEQRGLLDSLLWFGADYGPGDPLRWSPTAVELLLTDWLPRKIIADAGCLAKAPNLLRAFRTCWLTSSWPAASRSAPRHCSRPAGSPPKPSERSSPPPRTTSSRSGGGASQNCATATTPNLTAAGRDRTHRRRGHRPDPRTPRPRRSSQFCPNRIARTPTTIRSHVEANDGCM
jgi:hypothetical protein